MKEMRVNAKTARRPVTEVTGWRDITSLRLIKVK